MQNAQITSEVKFVLCHNANIRKALKEIEKFKTQYDCDCTLITDEYEFEIGRDIDEMLQEYKERVTFNGIDEE